MILVILHKMNRYETNPEFQKKVLPLLNNAENEIKILITFYILNKLSMVALKLKIEGICRKLGKELPNELIDKKQYVDGLYNSSLKIMQKEFQQINKAYNLFIGLLIASSIKVKESEVNTPAKAYAVANEWAAAKGDTTLGYSYQKLVIQALNGNAKSTIVTSTEGKKPITLWQKVELDLRHDDQKAKLDALKNAGVKLAWTSTHPDCSKRCEPWQGKLFDLEAEHSQLSNFRMNYKVDGNTVYCFKEVEAVVDKYGYQNNIINGFNCRHKLIPYTPKSVAPQEYTEKQIKKERYINAQIKAMERKIRGYKAEYNQKKLVDKTRATVLKSKIEDAISILKDYCKENGFPFEEYRL